MKRTNTLLVIEETSNTATSFVRFVNAHELPYQCTVVKSISGAALLLKKNSFDAIVANLSSESTAASELFGFTQYAPLIVAVDADAHELADNALKAGASGVVTRDHLGKHLPMMPITLEKAISHREAKNLYSMLTHAVMSTSDSVFITGMDGRILFVNHAFCNTYGYSETEVLGMNASTLADTEDAQTPEHAPSSAGLAFDKEMDDDIYHKTKSGKRFPVLMSSSIVASETGDHAAIVSLVRDISARKCTENKLLTSLKEKDVLVKEVHHRVKNNLQIISSLLNLQAGYVKDETTLNALRDSQNRVKSMALIHERLYNSEDISSITIFNYIQDLVRHVQNSYAHSGHISIHVDVDKGLLLDVDTAIPCGLIINEAVSNSLRHGFPDKDQGVVIINITMRTENEQKFMTLVIEDTGTGFPNNFQHQNTPSLGMQLISTLALQVKGTLKTNTGPGARITITFPVA